MILLYTKMNVLRNNEKTMLINGQNLSDGSGKNMQKSNEEDNFEPIGKDDLLQTMDTLDDEIKLTEQALAEIRNLTMNSTHDQKNDGSYNQTNGTSDADILSKLKELEDKSHISQKKDLLLRLRNQQMESQLTNMSSKIKFAKIIVDEEQKIVQWFRTMATAGIQTAHASDTALEDEEAQNGNATITTTRKTIKKITFANLLSLDTDLLAGEHVRLGRKCTHARAGKYVGCAVYNRRRCPK